MGKQPRKSGATITRIAEDVGVSTATVSRVFNGSDQVRPELAERVLQAAQKRNFVPRQSTRRDTLVLVLEDGTETTYTNYVANMIKELVHLCAEKKLRLDIVPAPEIPLIRGKYIMGAIALLWETDSLQAFRELTGTRKVAINAECGVPAVVTDERGGMETAIDYLMRHGHRHIALVARDYDSYGDVSRRKHFQDLLKERSAEGVEGECILFDGNEKSLLASLAKSFRGRLAKSRDQDPTALIATSENTGIQLMHCLDLLGMRVPDDVSVLSHEAAHQSEYLLPPHTTLSQQFGQIVARALDTISEEASGKPGVERIPFRLIERESVADLSG